MRSSKYNDLLENQEVTPMGAFLESYNKSAPSAFPLASEETLKEFQEAYPSLFKNKNARSIDKHRKRFMDWISSRKESE